MVWVKIWTPPPAQKNWFVDVCGAYLTKNFEVPVIVDSCPMQPTMAYQMTASERLTASPGRTILFGLKLNAHVLDGGCFKIFKKQLQITGHHEALLDLIRDILSHQMLGPEGDS